MLAYWLEEFWQRNQDRIDELGRYFFAAAVVPIPPDIHGRQATPLADTSLGHKHEWPGARP